MQPSIHYYVLLLSNQTSRLFEGFRDKLIDIQNTNFPLGISIDAANPDSQNTQLREFFNQTDQHFAHYYQQDPLPLVIVGEKSNLAIFIVLTTHWDAVIGTIKGNYSATSLHDLGKIVWPIVKEAISGVTKNAMHDLATAAKAKKVVSGIDAVGQSTEKKIGSTLYVEEDYHVKGSIHHKADHSLIISNHVNIWEVIDDVVDFIIEQVLKMGGTVIFMNSGALVNLERIALVLPN
ncbi:MAG: hypothetical protein U5R06_01570 [candidate division KSB1 bacterium]|nr:hypothetical protein [candidate division KSB1 bacterium]